MKPFEIDLVERTDFLKRSEHCSAGSTEELFGMLKQLVRVGNAFPNRLFVAVSLLLCLCADGAWAAQTRKSDCTSASNKNKPPCVVESPIGQVTVFWPKLRASNAVGQVLESKMVVWIDKVRVGMVDRDAPLTISLPNGAHTLELKPYDDWLENIRPTKATQITISAQKPLYLQIIHQGWAINASELDASTAQGVLPGGEPKDEGNASTSQAAVSDKETRNKGETFPSLASLFSDDKKAPSGPPATIHLYWPRPALDFGFLDKFNTAVPVILNGKRIGAITTGEYLVVTVPSGEQVLGLDVDSSSGRLPKQAFVLGAGTTRYFHVQHHDEFRMAEDSPEEAADYAKGLKQREVSPQ
ncbi:MAG: hypothetical protein WAN43_15065 [Rhodomicrobium sp.]